jgi:hypothetical protein
MFGARTRGANIESVAPKQPRWSDVPAQADQRDCGDNDCEPGVMDCRSPGKARIPRGV